MRRLIVLALLLWVPSAIAEQPPKDNTLTSKEIAEGWLLLFDGETGFGWSGNGTSRAVDGKLEIKGEGKKARALASGRFQNFELRFDFLEVADRPDARLFIDRGGERVTIALQDGQPPKDPWRKARITVHGEQVTFAGISQDSVTMPTKPPYKAAQLEWNAPPGSTLYLRNVKLQPLSLTSIFSGKDLSGWKEFPGRKSKFTITPEGAINIKDGPGDLQTEGKYADFVLQFDCISNGQHLNSGVFFRCRPNEYQNGYEAQIRNQFTAEPTQEYVVEHYDATTNKLALKQKEKFTAVDYGTGAIYRRQPARKEVARDGAWFTMTIVAHKNHLATWVNGIQVADWTDNRPRSDNARTGCRLEAGHISLQGHDPTTDLSFRRFRIAEMQ